jgi:hypothetical protein
MEGTYDPQKVIINWAGITFGGFADGSMVTAARDEDAFTKTVGADGSVARTRNANRSGKVTVRLKFTSLTNTLLSAAAIADASGTSVVDPLIIKDASSDVSLVHGENAWIMKMPDFERGKELGMLEWVFDVPVLDIVHGSQNA